MSQHTARIEWACQGSFSHKRYSRAHAWHFDGGIVVPASSSPHVVPLPYSEEAAVDPEEAFVASIASCHMLWFLDMAATQGWQVTSYRDEAIGTMGRDAQNRLVVSTVLLRPVAHFANGPVPSLEVLNHLHHRAHEACFIANSVNTHIVCEPQLP